MPLHPICDHSNLIWDEMRQRFFCKFCGPDTSVELKKPKPVEKTGEEDLD